MTTNRLLAVVVLPVVLVLAFLATYVLGGVRSEAAADEASDSAGIVVSGTGKVEAAADQLEFTVGIRRRAESVDEALGKANDLVRVVRKALIGAGVQNKRIRTADLSIEPTFRYRDGEEQITGYVAGQELTVRVLQIKDAGKVIGAVVGAGGDGITVRNIRMVLENRDKAMAQARAEAIEDARQNARQFAQAAGRKLGRLVFVEQEGARPVTPEPYEGYNRTMSLGDASVALKSAPISVGQEELQVKVSVRWALD